MGPINYAQAFGSQDPTQAFMQGLQGAMGMRAMLSQQQAQEQALAAAQAKAQAQEQMQADIAQVFNGNPDPKAVLGLMGRYPQLSEQYKRVYDGLSAEQQRSSVALIGRVGSALRSGNTPVALKVLDDEITAARNSGDEESAKAMESIRKATEIDPAFGLSTAYSLAAASGDAGQKLADAWIKEDENKRAVDLHGPAVLKAQADAAKAGSDAKTSAVTAEYARPMAEDQVKQRAAELGLTKAQAAQAYATTKKLGAETQKSLLEVTALTNGTPDPGKKFDAETKLRGEFIKDIGQAADMKQSYARIRASQDNAVGDLSLIFGYMKMLDPGSVVREGEFANAQNAAGVPERVWNLYNRLVSGERLTPGQRKAFIAQAGKLAATADERINEVKTRLSPVVKAYRLDEKNVFGEPQQAAPEPPANEPTATNPKTGERLVLRNGQWVPLK